MNRKKSIVLLELQMICLSGCGSNLRCNDDFLSSDDAIRCSMHLHLDYSAVQQVRYNSRGRCHGTSLMAGQRNSCCSFSMVSMHAAEALPC